MEQITNEEFNNWLQSPVTRAFFETLESEQSALAEGLSQGAYLNDPNEKLYMGYVRAIREVMNPDNIREEIVMEESDE